MARPRGLEFSGALYHVTSRSNRQEALYEKDTDREGFLFVLADVCKTSNWKCHAYCLMDNHYHLLIETPDANLSKGMRQLNGIYTQNFNRVHHRAGHVFQGRYKAILIDKNSYLLELSRYIVLNPVRAQMVRFEIEWVAMEQLSSNSRRASQTRMLKYGLLAGWVFSNKVKSD